MIFVTGAYGFIGSNFVKKLNEEGIKDITLIDKFTKEHKWKNIIDLEFDSLIDRDYFIEHIENLVKVGDTIVHLGACTNTMEPNADKLMLMNYFYTKKIILFAVNNNIKFINTSSASVYGDGELGFDDDEEKTKNYKPLNPYALSKHLVDKWLIDKKYIEKISSLRFFNVFGPREYHKSKMASVIYHAYKPAKETKTIKLFKSYKKEFKDGEQKRDFIYVKDVVDIVYHFMTNDITGIFNVGTGKARSFNDLANAIFQALNIKGDIEYIDMPEHLKEKYQYFTEADTRKLREKAKYTKSFTSLEKAVEDYVINFLDKIY